MKIYIVTCGEKYEGGYTVGVYSDHSKAVDKALAQKCRFEGGWEIKSYSEDYWENGCDYVYVTEHEVE